MDKPRERIKELQDIQMLIARIVDEHRGVPGRDKLVYYLREAFTNLNEAKAVILDAALLAQPDSTDEQAEEDTAKKG